MCVIMRNSFSQEIADESDLTYMERGRLESEFRKLKESKKKAEQYAVEAKQTAQRLSAENFKLREDLSKERHDNELTRKNIMREIEKDAGRAVVKSRTEVMESAVFKEEVSARAFELIHDGAGKSAHPRSKWNFTSINNIIICRGVT